MRLRNLLALTAVLTAACGTLAAAESTTTSRSTAYVLPTKPASTFYNPDLFYDYQVWAAPEVTNYYVVAEYTNGGISEYKFTTENGAQQFQQWLYFHIAELKKATIDVRVEAGEYVLIQTFDKRADAQDFAALLQSVGLYVEIHSVSILQFYQP
jgi:DNA-binding beta-propeller fold protein YncE